LTELFDKGRTVQEMPSGFFDEKRVWQRVRNYMRNAQKIEKDIDLIDR